MHPPIQVISNGSETDHPQQLFDINLMYYYCCAYRSAWAQTIADELPKIGIKVELYSGTINTIPSRTYDHPRDGSRTHNGFGKVPIFQEGGYDILVSFLRSSLAFEPSSSYSNEEFSPVSLNVASYDNNKISSLISEHEKELDGGKRSNLAKQIQSYAHFDLPYINIINSGITWVYDEEWTSFTQNDLLFLDTLNKRDGWKTMDHPLKENIVYALAHAFELNEFSPFSKETFFKRQHLTPIYVGLYERDITDPSFAFKPILAKSLPIWSENNTVATIEVNTDATFSTGESVTVDDIVNSFHMHLDPLINKNQFSYYTAYGAWKKETSLSDFISSNDSVFKVDESHLQIRMNKPTFLATQMFSIPIFDMDEIGTPINPLGSGEDGSDYDIDPWKYHGAGPFKYAEDQNHGINQEDGIITLEKVVDYWNGEVNLDTIKFKKYGSKEEALSELESGKVHIIDANLYFESGEVEGVPGVAYEIIDLFKTETLVINMDHPILGTGIDTPLGVEDPSKAEDAARYVRQAISHIIPREYILDEFLKGVGLIGTTLWPPMALDYDDTLIPHKYNITIARGLMEMAGYRIQFKDKERILDTMNFVEVFIAIIVIMQFLKVTRRPLKLYLQDH
jgi:ABC-type transport system substrate-binding protein